LITEKYQPAEEADYIQGINGLCPVCSSPLDDGERCPKCDPSSFTGTPFGESTPSRTDFRRIIGRVPSTREHNYFRSLFTNDEERRIGEGAQAAMERINLDQHTKSALAMRITLMAKRFRSKGLSINESILLAANLELSFLGVDDVQSASSGSQLQTSTLRPLVFEVISEDPHRISVTVAGAQRRLKIWPLNKGGRNCFSVCVPLLEYDAGALIQVHNATLARVADKKVSVVDTHTLRLKRCFSKSFRIFKLMKEVVVDGELELPDKSIAYMRRYSLSSLPLTARIAREARCAGRLQSRFEQLFKQALTKGMGRSPRSLAKEAMLQADVEIYSSLSPEAKASVALAAAQAGVTPRKNGGLVVVSELKGWDK
jgi:hypothetical protein